MSINVLQAEYSCELDNDGMCGGDDAVWRNASQSSTKGRLAHSTSRRKSSAMSSNNLSAPLPSALRSPHDKPHAKKITIDPIKPIVLSDDDYSDSMPIIITRKGSKRRGVLQKSSQDKGSVDSSGRTFRIDSGRHSFWKPDPKTLKSKPSFAASGSFRRGSFASNRGSMPRGSFIIRRRNSTPAVKPPERLQSVLPAFALRRKWEDTDVHLSKLVPVSADECRSSRQVFYTNYTMERVLGKGSFGEVWMVKDRCTGYTRACKIIPKPSIHNRFMFDRKIEEVKVLRELDHPNVIRLLDFYEDRKNLFLITDYLSGGELFVELSKKKRFKQERVAVYIRQILKGLAYIHGKGVVHRDLKCENILLDKRRNSKYPDLKIIDFGLSFNIQTQGVRNTKVGTYQYMAPEVITQNSPNSSCDIWSVGVILFMMMFGYPPFTSSMENRLFSKILRGKIKFNSRVKKELDDGAIELINAVCFPISFLASTVSRCASSPYGFLSA
eukprot:GHVH01005730.1.p1 GENE.GHVH01005730.1~~GHVH01005730.1.p1  ORF type:complete len:497 (+),score=39.58 GHVH01005730.1:146-1636(+)